MVKLGDAVRAKRGIYKGQVGTVVSVKNGKVVVYFGRNKKSTFNPESLEVVKQ